MKLLGEALVAFRDTQGEVGLIDEFCAHRRASLFLGRNEEGGLRCVYHGWKYDVQGNCTDMPNEPPENRFNEKIRLKAYPTVELGNVIWAFMGAAENLRLVERLTRVAPNEIKYEMTITDPTTWTKRPWPPSDRPAFGLHERREREVSQRRTNELCGFHRKTCGV